MLQTSTAVNAHEFEQVTILSYPNIRKILMMMHLGRMTEYISI